MKNLFCPKCGKKTLRRIEDCEGDHTPYGRKMSLTCDNTKCEDIMVYVFDQHMGDDDLESLRGSQDNEVELADEDERVDPDHLEEILMDGDIDHDDEDRRAHAEERISEIANMLRHESMRD